jgi:hypothetical protein
MSQKSMIPTGLTVLLMAVAAAGPVRAADTACKPALDAMAKQIATPSHVYMTEVAEFRGGKPVSSEAIYTDGVIYIQVRGKWRRSPESIQQTWTSASSRASSTGRSATTTATCGRRPA